VQAGNIRLEGLYFDRQGNQGNYDRIFSGSAVHVGLSCAVLSLPRPHRIADFKLRIPGDKRIASVVATVGPLRSIFRRTGYPDTHCPGETEPRRRGGIFACCL